MKCRKLFTGILSLTLAVSSVCAPVSAQYSMTAVHASVVLDEDPLTEGVLYKNCGDHIEITGFDKTRLALSEQYAHSIVIPEHLEGLPVTKIVPGAFKGIRAICEVWLPSTLEEIGDEAFAGCLHVYMVNFSPVLHRIGKRAFYRCQNIQTIILPDSLTEIGEEAFSGVQTLHELVLPDSLRTIRRGVFAGDAYMKILCIPASVERIETDAFAGCERLEQVCYKGSADAWAVLSRGSGNAYLDKAEILCDYNKQKVERSYTFDPEKDTWGFLNKELESYALSEDKLEEMTAGMYGNHQSNIQTNWKKANEAEYPGACLGFAITSMLAASGILDPSELDPDAACLHDVKLTDEVRELLTYYWLLQYNEYITWRADIWSEQKLVYYLEQGIPVVCSYGGTYNNKDGNKCGFEHAVLAYGVEEGHYEFDGTVFTIKLLTYDSNVNAENGRDGSIYFCPEDLKFLDDVRFQTQTIYVPYVCQEHSDVEMTMTPSMCSLDYINLHGHNKGIDYAEPEQKCALLRSAALPADYRMQCYAPDTPESKADASCTQVKAGKYQALQCADGQKGYVLEMQDKQALDCSMSYENWLYAVNGSDVTSAAFEPDGSVSIKGEDMQYQLTVTADEEQHPTSYYELRISGKNADQVGIRQTDGGYLITGTDLQNVTVDAMSGIKEVSLDFSTDADHVLVYEPDRFTLAVSADLDKDGTYETTLATSAYPIPGDMNEDGAIDAADATEILIASVRLAAEPTELTQGYQKAADVNQDGKIDAEDATRILQYAVEAGTGSEVTFEEYLRQIQKT